jgi:hypothetical protein
MKYEYTDKQLTPWGGMREMKSLLETIGISKKLS